MIVLPILTTSLIHLPSKRLGECTFLNSGVKGLTGLDTVMNMVANATSIVALVAKTSMADAKL